VVASSMQAVRVEAVEVKAVHIEVENSILAALVAVVQREAGRMGAARMLEEKAREEDNQGMGPHPKAVHAQRTLEHDTCSDR